MAQAPTALPPSVADQIRLWELERDRFVFTPVSMYCNFQSEEDYQQLANFARRDGCVQWQSAQKRLLLLSADSHNRVKSFWKTVRRD